MLIKKNDKISIKRRISWSCVSLVTLFLDGLYIGFWALIQYLFNHYVWNKNLFSGIDKNVLLTLRYIFAVATVVPVFVFITSDIIVIIKQAIELIKNEDDVDE